MLKCSRALGYSDAHISRALLLGLLCCVGPRLRFSRAGESSGSGAGQSAPTTKRRSSTSQWCACALKLCWSHHSVGEGAGAGETLECACSITPAAPALVTPTWAQYRANTLKEGRPLSETHRAHARSRRASVAGHVIKTPAAIDRAVAVVRGLGSLYRSHVAGHCGTAKTATLTYRFALVGSNDG